MKTMRNSFTRVFAVMFVLGANVPVVGNVGGQALPTLCDQLPVDIRTEYTKSPVIDKSPKEIRAADECTMSGLGVYFTIQKYASAAAARARLEVLRGTVVATDSGKTVPAKSRPFSIGEEGFSLRFAPDDDYEQIVFIRSVYVVSVSGDRTVNLEEEARRVEAAVSRLAATQF